MPQWLVPIGRVFYAIGLIGIGIQHFIFADFIAVVVPYWPSWIPGRPIWPYIFGSALILAGGLMLANIKARMVAAVTGAVFLILLVVLDTPAQFLGSPAHLGVWTNTFKALSLAGGAWMVAESLDRSAYQAPAVLESLMPFGRLFLPITVVLFGIDHFLYPDFVSTLVPAWIPGRLFWSYFAGVALIAAGAAMVARVQERLAALLLGIMIFLWLPLLHIPRAIADPHSGNGNEWTSVFEALAFSGIAFIQAASADRAFRPSSLATKAART